MNNNFELSIIIVSYNTQDLLKNCLNSIHHETQKTKYEVIIVDNGSTDGSISLIRDNKWPFPVSLILNDENKGYGIANNQGVTKAKGEWILLLNSDTKLMDGTIDKLFQRKKDNQILAPQLLNADATVQPSAGFFPTIARAWAQMLFIDDLPYIKTLFKPYQQSDPAFYLKPQQPDWVTGAFLLISKDTFNQVNGFDESIFMYGEEVDLCYRLHTQLQTTCHLIPEVQCLHYKGKSSPDGFQAAVVGEYKGLISIYKKHFPGQLELLKIALKAGALLRTLIFGIISPYKASIYRKAIAVINQ